MRGWWTCQRVHDGERCGTLNPNRRHICERCGKRRPPRRKPDHLKALELDYEGFVILNGGEQCAICGRAPNGRRLDRDHDHASGLARGLLCHRCNRALPNRATPEWLRDAAAYLERAR